MSNHIRPMGVPDDDRVDIGVPALAECKQILVTEPQPDIYEEAITALLKLVNHDGVTHAQAAQVLDTMVSPLRAIRRRNQFLPLKDYGMTIDEAISHFKESS
jgi:hypothetical protein